MQSNIAQMAQAMTGLTQMMAQQANVATAQAAENAQRVAAEAEANAQRLAAENERRAQQEEREAARVQNRGLADFTRHDPPKFKGGADPEKADLWLQEVEKIFEVLRTPAESKMGYAAYLLLGEAEYWWRGAKLIMEGNNQEVTWIAFREAFLNKYFPVSARAEKEAEFLRFRQGTLSVAEYAAKLESLAKYFRFFRNQIDEGYLCERFLEGLNYDIVKNARPLGIREFQPLVEKCREIEVTRALKTRRPASGGPIKTEHQDKRNWNKGKKD